MKRYIYTIALAVLTFIISGCAEKTETFTLWQLPSQVNTIGNSYVIQSVNGKLIVMDGGTKDETEYLRGFISALGEEVDAWFISHPHGDHFGALSDILKEPKGVKINRIYHSKVVREDGSMHGWTGRFYSLLDSVAVASSIDVIDCHRGDEFEIDGINFKILSEKNPELLPNINDQSMVIRMWDESKSFVFLGDLGEKGGRKLMESEYMEDVNCDYLQMAHHGQDGCDKEFYDRAQFRACLWPSPSWVYNNDTGDGFNTAHLKTVEVRGWIQEKGITEHYVSNEGLCCIR